VCVCVCVCVSFVCCYKQSEFYWFVHVSDMEGDAAAALLPVPNNASVTLCVGFEIPKDKNPKEFIEDAMRTKLSTRSNENLGKCRKQQKWPTHRIWCVHGKEHHKKKTDNKSDRSTNTKKGSCPVEIVLKKLGFQDRKALNDTKKRHSKRLQNVNQLEEALCKRDVFFFFCLLPASDFNSLFLRRLA